jgi:drug/metabolite transporter (DMT)-like permease
VHVASSLAAIVVATVPLIGAVLALRYDPSERPTRIRALGLVIGFIGVVALVGLDVAGNGSELLGALAIVVAAIGYSIGPMIIKQGFEGLDTRALMGASLALATVILAPFAAVDTPTRSVTAGAWGAVATLGVFCTALAFVVVTVLIREAGTSRAMVFTYINPVVALALGVTLESERPGAGAIAGLVFILAGSWLSTTGRFGWPRAPLGTGREAVVRAPAGPSTGRREGDVIRSGTADRLLD